MISQFFKSKKDLNHHIFQYVTGLGVLICLLLFFVEVFIRKDYLSAFINLFLIVFLSIFFVLGRYLNKNGYLVVSLVLLLNISANVSWFTSGGSSPVNMMIFCTVSLATIAMLNGSSKYIYVVINALNILILGNIEYFNPNIVVGIPFFQNSNSSLNSNLGVFITLVSSNLIIAYLKDRFELDKLVIEEQLFKLNQSKLDAEIRNLELEQKNSKILDQQAQIEVNNQVLNNQSLLLKDALKQLAILNVDLEKRVEQRTRETKELNKELDLLFYRSSHDIRGPLMSLRGLVNLGIMAEMKVENIWIWDKLSKTIDKLEHVTRKFVMISEINHFQFEKYENTIELIINNLFGKYTYFLNEFQKSYSIQTFSLAPNDPRNLLIEIILDNLIENAIHFRRKIVESELKISITEGIDYFELKVFDNGWGIPMDIIPRVAEMYFRGNENSKGNGLGLYVVATAVKKVVGTIDIESVIGKYTLVTIRIPLVLPTTIR